MIIAMADRGTYKHQINLMKLSASDVVLRAAAEDDGFSVSSYTINRIEDENKNTYVFPGNIAPEGYFYSPFYKVTLKELDDEPQFIPVKRINFDPSGASVTSANTEVYNPEMGIISLKTLYTVEVTSPISYNFLNGQPFVIYDVMNDNTYRGYLSKFNSAKNGTCRLSITVESESAITQELLDGESGKSGYIISFMEENAPIYAEFVPSSQKLIWRAPKKMSDLSSESPIYNMPFTNGRLYIHRNLNVFVRRQDPNNDFKLFRPSQNNPLRRFQVEGDAKLDFDYIQQIIDSMVDAC